MANTILDEFEDVDDVYDNMVSVFADVDEGKTFLGRFTQKSFRLSIVNGEVPNYSEDNPIEDVFIELANGEHAHVNVSLLTDDEAQDLDEMRWSG